MVSRSAFPLDQNPVATSSSARSFDIERPRRGARDASRSDLRGTWSSREGARGPRDRGRAREVSVSVLSNFSSLSDLCLYVLIVSDQRCSTDVPARLDTCAGESSGCAAVRRESGGWCVRVSAVSSVDLSRQFDSEYIGKIGRHRHYGKTRESRRGARASRRPSRRYLRG